MNDALLTIHHRVESASSATIVLRGELDLAGEPALTSEVAAVLDRLAPGAVCTVQLDEVTFVDSTGLGCLLRCASTASSAGVTWRCIRPSAPVLRLFELTNTGHLMGLVDTTVDAAA